MWVIGDHYFNNMLITYFKFFDDLHKFWYYFCFYKLNNILVFPFRNGKSVAGNVIRVDHSEKKKVNIYMFELCLMS